ncbi:MAG TPA: Gfo/Idh/MocA family oxidoreductase [Vicinamibacterales bacterium]|nr:Gfo/Idh/MocA family oxidoreductase [Vicinamibacterales bacterium]
MIRAALIGAGEISLQHLACLHTLPGVTLAGVCDRSPALAECAADRFGAGAWFVDHRAMLDAVRPDVVHVTTPVASHFQLAMDALEAGAHVIVEKPVCVAHDQVLALLRSARDRRRVVIENYNYLFNAPVQRIGNLMKAGDLGEVVHVDVTLCLDLAHTHHLAGRAQASPDGSWHSEVICDFLPHLASLAHFFVGPHRAVRAQWSRPTSGPRLPLPEFRALIEAELATAALVFSARGQPDTFNVEVQGTKMRASAELYDRTLVVNRQGNDPGPIARLRSRLGAARALYTTAVGGFFTKLTDGRGAFDGLWSLLARTYAALESGAEPPVSPRQIAEVNDLVAALGAEESRF